MRKLEFLLAEVVAKGHDCVITIGGIQSNHCRATAVAARCQHLQHLPFGITSCLLVLCMQRRLHSAIVRAANALKHVSSRQSAKFPRVCLPNTYVPPHALYQLVVACNLHYIVGTTCWGQQYMCLRRYLGLDTHLILRNSRELADSDPGLTGNLLLARMVSHADYCNNCMSYLL